MQDSYSKLLAFLDLKPIDVPMIVVCSFLFIALWKILAKNLFNPYLKVVEAREQKTTGATDILKSQRESIQKIAQEVDLGINEARVAAIQKKISAISKAKTEAAQLLERAQAQADELLAQGRKEQQLRTQQTRSELSQKVDQLVEEVTRRASQPLSAASSSTQLLIIMVVAATSAILPNLAFAGGGHGEAGHGGGFSALIPFWVNFIIYCTALYFLLRRTVRAGWASRVSGLRAAVEKSTVELQSVREELANAEKRRASLPQQVAALQSKIAQETENEVSKILADAREQASALVAQAKGMLETERRSQESSLRREVAEEVVSRARTRLQKDATLDNDRVRRDASVTGIPLLVKEGARL